MYVCTQAHVGVFVTFKVYNIYSYIIIRKLFICEVRYIIITMRNKFIAIDTVNELFPCVVH